ncbi:MAG: hypothetical protein JNL67_14495 [Planctomycetaceae bacterium]|nr:hypothetical protein [Planctomycetaceae bacterium]
MKLSEIAIKATTGQKYKFTTFTIDARCRELPGVYIVTHREEDERGEAVHRFLSIGQTDNLNQWRDAMPDIQCHESLLANCVGVLYEPDYQTRNRIVQEIRESFEMPCG